MRPRLIACKQAMFNELIVRIVLCIATLHYAIHFHNKYTHSS